jgi:glycosyltransferase involved in cell wall biosynthesis
VKTPLVSVLMPIYNAEPFLSQAIASVTDQSFGDFELLLVDDGSSDASKATIAAAARRDPRVRPFFQPHTGLVPTLNFGLRQATGEWIARMDADDICEPDRLEAQIAFVERHPGIGAAGTYARYITPTGRVLGLYREGPTSISEFQQLLRDGELIRLIHPTVMMNRSAVIDAGEYDADFKLVEDVDLYNRLADRGHFSLALPEIKLSYRIHPRSVVITSHLEMSRMFRFVRAVVLRRRNRETPPTYDEFLRFERSASLLRRANRTRRDLSAFFYRLAAVRFASGHAVRGGASVCLAATLAPATVLWKLRAQFLPTRRHTRVGADASV